MKFCTKAFREAIYVLIIFGVIIFANCVLVPDCLYWMSGGLAKGETG